MKVIDLLENVTPLVGYSVFSLIGDDSALQTIAVEKILECRRHAWREMETVHVSNLSDTIDTYLEPAIFEAAVTRVFTTRPVKGFAKLADVDHDTENSLILVFDEPPTGDLLKLIESKTQPIYTTFPKKISSKLRLIVSLARGLNLDINPNHLELIAPKMTNATDLVVLLNTLRAVTPDRFTVTRNDLMRLLPDTETSWGDVSIAVLTGNSLAITEIVRDTPPLLLLSNTNSFLLKLHSWVLLTASDPSGEADEENAKLIGVASHVLKYWRRARKGFASKRVRFVMEELAQVYQDCIRGDSAMWEVRTVKALRRLLK